MTKTGPYSEGGVTPPRESAQKFLGLPFCCTVEHECYWRACSTKLRPIT